VGIVSVAANQAASVDICEDIADNLGIRVVGLFVVAAVVKAVRVAFSVIGLANGFAAVVGANAAAARISA
jgi:hypothetical protein